MGESGDWARLVCARRSKWVVVGLWLVLLVVVSPLAQKLMDAQDNDAQSWLPGSAESTQVLNLADGFRPDTAPAIVIYARDSGLTAQDRAVIAEDARAVRTLDQDGVLGAQTRGPVYDSPSAPEAAQLLVPILMDENGWERIADAVDSIRAETGTSRGGLAVHITGPGGTAADSAEAFAGIDSTLLLAALGVVVVMLLLTYRSPTLLVIPVIAVIGALFTAQALIYLLAVHADLTVNAQSAGILTVLVFGAGTDYALLLVARYREELRRHEDRHEAMALALHRAGPAVLASGATVGAGMLCLLAADMNSTRGLGPVAAIGVAVALAALVTLFPALLVIFSRWIFWPVVPHHGSPEPTESGLWARTGRRIARRPRAVWVAGALVLAVASIGLTELKAGGLTYAESFTERPDSVVGQEVQAKYFPAGTGSPLVIITKAGAAQRVAVAVADTRGVVPESVGPPPGVPAEHDGLAYLEATLTDPADGPAAKATVERVRDAAHAVPGGEAKVGGGTAALVDLDTAATHDNILIIPMILVVVFVILGLLLRAVTAPLVLIGTVVLSFSAALGISAVVFRHVFGFADEDAAFPLFVFVFLVALGIDYNIFLTTRIREEAAKLGTRRGALLGLAATGGVITSAGLVLAGTFAALGTLPLVGFAEIGFTVALGVLLDTFVVRSVLVSALFLDIGRPVWWPSRVDPPEAQPPPDAAERGGHAGEP